MSHESWRCLLEAFLESMHSVGGNWTRLVDRGPLNINEHVNFYAKVRQGRNKHWLTAEPLD